MGFLNETPLSLSEVKTTTTTKRCSLGTRGVTSDGRVFHYALAGGALVIGDLVQTAPAGKLNLAGNQPGMDTQDITSTWTKIRITATGSTWTEPCLADEYADGYLVVEASTQALTAGQVVRIKSNTVANDSVAAASTGSGLYYTDVTFNDDDRLIKGLDTDATIQLISNEYYKVVQFAAVTTMVGKLLGVPLCAVASGSYFWLQTWGVAVVRTQDTTILGNVLVVNELTTGATGTVAPMDGTTGTTSSIASLALGGIVGYQLGASPGSGDYGLMFLTISP